MRRYVNLYLLGVQGLQTDITGGSLQHGRKLRQKKIHFTSHIVT